MDAFEIARVCREVNRAFCESIGDLSIKSWEEAPDWQKESAVNGVMYHFENPDATPMQSHQCWMDEKLAKGWTWGPVKDEAKKQHPCIVPYSTLP